MSDTSLPFCSSSSFPISCPIYFWRLMIEERASRPASCSWIIFYCCCRISSKPKPLVSSGSSKSQGLGAPRLAPPVIRLDLRTRLNALHSSKNPARPQIAPTGAEGASLACFENSFRPQFIASLVYASNCVQGWKRYEDE